MKTRRKLLTAVMIAAAVLLAVAAYNYIRIFLLTGQKTPDGNPGSEKGTACSFFIYLCGSDLESRQGLAGRNIDDLLKTDIPDHVNVLIETGGAKEWHSHNISNQKLQRYLIKDKKLNLLEEREGASMGSAGTLAGFLRWGKENYPAERNFVVLWDHGGSSAEGVCFDENFDYDCLERAELKDAFSSSGIKDYDMLILDTCYMGSLETADLAKDHFRYMAASQMVIPGDGMDYAAIIGALDTNDDSAVGKVLCDSFYEKCKKNSVEDDVQMSFFDLKETGAVLKAVDSAGKNLLLRQKKHSGSFRIIEAASDSVIGRAGEKTNVVDLLRFLDSAILLDIHAHRYEVSRMIEALVPYQVKGENAECSGVSLFFPVNYEESQLNRYLEICPIETYGTLLENVYSSVPEDPIQFEDRGSVNKDGDFEVKLTEESRPYLFAVSRVLWKAAENNPGRFELLGSEGVRVYDTGLRDSVSRIGFSDPFDGKWYYLGGFTLLTSVKPHHLTTSCSAPVRVNAQDLRFTFARLNRTGKILSHGFLSEESDRYGLPGRKVAALKEGDRVQVYHAVDEMGEFTSAQKEFRIRKDEDLRVEYQPLPEGRYRLQYVASDILGNSIASDYAMLEINGNNDDRIITVTEIREAY